MDSSLQSSPNKTKNIATVLKKGTRYGPTLFTCKILKEMDRKLKTCTNMQIWKITHVLIIYSEYQFYDTAGYIF